MKFPAKVLVQVSAVVMVVLSAASSHAQKSWTGRWLERVTATQALQPHWMTPIATVTPRLEQEFRFDSLHEVTPSGNLTNFDGGKGLELIPSKSTELLINLPPYLMHENPKDPDGFGDASFTVKYRLWSRDEEGGNGILTAFLGGSIPTGTYKNGSNSAVVTPTLAGGKGWGWFDVQSTLTGTLPVNSVHTVGRTIALNTAFQAHAMRLFWPEVEINSTFWKGGANDGKKQTFVTPAVIVGRFRIHHRVALVAGAGFQIAATHYNQYNHAVLATIRMPF